MNAFDFKSLERDYVLVKLIDSNLMAWTAPRGINVDSITERWTLNPDKAHVYKTLSAAFNALQRAKERNEQELVDAYPMTLAQFTETNQRKTFGSLSELLKYYPKIRTVYNLEYSGKVTWLANEDDLHSVVNGDSYTLHTLKL